MRPRILRRRLALMAFGAILAGASIGVATRAEATPREDYAYLATLDHFGVPYSNAQAAITVGHAVCSNLDNGVSLQTLVTTGQLAGGYSRADAETIVGAAIGAYCDQYMRLVMPGRSA